MDEKILVEEKVEHTLNEINRSHKNNKENNTNLNENEKNDNSKIDPDEYLTLHQIGWGNFSDVFLVEHKQSKKPYCLKVFEKNKIERMRKEGDVLIEKHVMKKLPLHNNIIKFIGSKADEFMLYILYEYVNGGELWKKCIYHGINSEKTIKYYFKQILVAIKHMHDNDIIHRDIKPENIMITKDSKTIKIIDFGSCKDLNGTPFDADIKAKREKEKRKRQTFEHYVGTPNFMAPECVHNKESTKKSDVFSLGCTLYQMYFGFPPFMGKSEYLIYLKSTKCDYKMPNENYIDENTVADNSLLYSKETEEYIKSMILLDPKQRPDVDTLLNSEYLKNIDDLLLSDVNNNYNINEIYIKNNCNKLLIKLISILDNSSIKYNDNCEISFVNNLLIDNLTILKQEYPLIDINDLLYINIINLITTNYKETKDYSNELDELIKEQKQFSDNPYKDNMSNEDKVIYDKRLLKIEELTIYVTNKENDFCYLFELIFNTIKEFKEINYLSIDLFKYYKEKFCLLKKQLNHEIFNIDIVF